MYILYTLFYYLSIFASTYTVSAASFSIGFEIDYKGVKPSGSHINLKEEILDDIHMTANTFNGEVIPKVNEYIKSNMAKAMKATRGYYGIPKATPMSAEHLIAVILYTDYTKLSSEFTASFRKKNPFENEEQVKKRNIKYWCWGRKLKEVMVCYGDQRAYYGLLKGPFYTGMSRVMTLSQFNIFLYSPTSTSVQLAVSLNFSGDYGMILSFNNDEGAARDTKGFDCSWLSRFKEEDERYDALNYVDSIKLYILYLFRLFFQAAGYFTASPLNISSIRILETGKNYEDITKPITVFDACISGQVDIPSADPSKKYGKVITQLINAQITGEAAQIDQYIMDTFNSFIKHKKKIDIKVEYVIKKVKDKELVNNIINKGESTEYKHGKTDVIRRESKDMTNLINSKIIKMFTNVQEIEMTINEMFNNNNIYTISLIGLLSIIESTSIKRVEISMYWKKKAGISWLSALWKSSSNELIQKYNNMGFDIKYDNNDIIINKL